MKSEKRLFILDVRPDSVFRGISTDAMANAQGKLKGAVNIPFAELPNALAKVPRDKPVLVVADFGRETNLAAKLLTDNGYSQVYALFNGMNQWISMPLNELPEKKELWVQHNSCAVITAEEMDAMIKKSPGVFFLDVRTKDEFTNQVKKESWKNRGHIENAVNIPADELESRLNEISDKKNRDIIVYTFNTSKEAFESANLLAAKGFKKVYVLAGGLWDVRWKAANLKGKSQLMKYVVDVPADNQ
jgi:rhodanese-related sulfurtransferase